MSKSSESKRLVKEEVHAALEKHFESHFQNDVFHTNKNEHKIHPFRFILRIGFFGLLGVVLGGLLNWAINRIKNDYTNRWTCSGILVLQMFTISFIFWIASFLLGATIDDWVMNTWAGFLFALTFFTAQSSLSNNIDCALGTTLL
jgi:tetrahydromethanopterin S-methyltransferase subunit D